MSRKKMLHSNQEHVESIRTKRVCDFHFTLASLTCTILRSDQTKCILCWHCIIELMAVGIQTMGTHSHMARDQSSATCEAFSSHDTGEMPNDALRSLFAATAPWIHVFAHLPLTDTGGAAAGGVVLGGEAGAAAQLGQHTSVKRQRQQVQEVQTCLHKVQFYRTT